MADSNPDCGETDCRFAHFDGAAIWFLLIENIQRNMIAHGAAVTIFAVAGRLVFGQWKAAIMVIVLYGVLLVIWATLTWRCLSVYIGDDTLGVREGVLFQSTRTLSLGRVQGALVKRTLLARVMGCIELSAHTAGGRRRPEVYLPGVPRDEALKKTLAAFGVPHAPAPDTGPSHNELVFEYRLPLSDIFVSGFTSNSVALALITIIIPLLTTVLGSLKQINLDPARILEQGILIWALSVVGVFVALLVALVGVAGKLLWDLSRKVLAGYGFRITRKDNVIHTTRGLVTNYCSFMQVHRIQAVSIERPFLQRIFGFGGVNLDTAGFDSVTIEGGSITSLVPILRGRRINELIEELLPEYVANPIIHHSDLRGLGRYTFGPSMLAGCALAVAVYGEGIWHWFAGTANATYAFTIETAVAWWLHPAAVIGLVVAILFLLTEVDVWFATGAATEQNILVLLQGRLGRREVRVYRDHIQGLTVRQTWFQKRDGHAHLHCYVVSGAKGRKITLRNLDTYVASSIVAWYDDGTRRESGGT